MSDILCDFSTPILYVCHQGRLRSYQCLFQILLPPIPFKQTSFVLLYYKTCSSPFLILFCIICKIHFISVCRSPYCSSSWSGHYYLCLDARKPVFGGLGKNRRRQACAFAQSDQRLCFLESIISRLATSEISNF